jgi:hypothetical protein
MLVGGHARDGEHRLRHIEAVHLGLPFADAPAIGELAGVAHCAWLRVEEVAVQRDDDLRVAQAVNRVQPLTERQPRPLVHIVAVNRLVLIPLRLRVGLQELADLRRQRG